MSDRPDIPEDDDTALAAEYVLGLLDGADRRAFERRLSEEPELRAIATAWEADFAVMIDDVEEVAPRAAVKARVMGAFDGPTLPRRRWAGWLALPGLATVALIAALLFAPILRGPDFDPTLHATLVSDDGSLVIEAGYAPDGSLFRVIREAGSAPPGRDLELWVIGPEAEAPVSLGVIPPEMQTTFEITPQIAALIDGGVLAVSDEPEGGSPTGAPTGDILATGAFFDV
ncbi:MAG: anti-sigma factor [Pseudomonadota bacterium]